MTARRGLALLVLAVLLAAAESARAGGGGGAPAGRVTLLQPSPVSASARRYLTRIREELLAGGFEVALAEFGAGVDPLWVIDPANQRDGTLATIALVGDPDAGAAELWIVDRVAGARSAVRRITVPAADAGHGDEVLAIRALEFLRASALELAQSATALPRPTVSAVAAPASPSPALAAAATPAAPPPPEPGPLSLAAGLSMLDSLGGAPGAALVPLARLRVDLSAVVGARLTLAGLGSRPRVVSPLGTASVGQELALVELAALFRPGRRIRPGASAGAGALLVSVDGEGAWPYEGRDGRRWAALLDAGAGVSAAVTRRLAVAVELHALLAAPYPTVRFSDTEGARIGRPSLLVSVTLVSAL